MCSAMNAAASSSSDPPISPQTTMAVVCGSFAKAAQAIHEGGPDDRVAPDADAGRLAQARTRQPVDHLIGQGPGAGDQPDVAFFEDVPRHDADRGLAGRDQPGAVRPDDPHPRGRRLHLEHVVDRDALRDADREARCPPRRPRYSASAAKAGGTKMQVWVAPVASTASSDRIEHRQAVSVVCPPFPGVTPPTMFVPYLTIRPVWYDPSAPVMP